MTENAEKSERGDGFLAGFMVMLIVGVVVLFTVLIGDTNGDTFVRDGVRYGRVCEKVGVISCGDWHIIGDAVEFVPTPVVIEVSK